MRVPKVLALHDVVCLGRCSLTVAIPTLSAMGVKVCPLPTALLSSDTGGYGPVYVRELTGDMEKVLEKVRALGEGFSAVYSGYLGSPDQAALVRRAMDYFPGLRVVDPVMGDEGRLYQNIDEGMVRAMRALCGAADVITPNLTEACFLSDTPLPKGPVDAKFALSLLERLRSLGCGSAVVTSVRLKGRPGELATLAQEKDGPAFALSTARVPAHFPGTGDLFASVLTGRLVGGASLIDAAATASDFVGQAVAFTLEQGTPAREGVLLEALLGRLQKVDGQNVERLKLKEAGE